MTCTTTIDHIYFTSFKELCIRERVWPKAVDRSIRPPTLKDGPRTLVCHDMMGGYLPEDKLEPIDVVDSSCKPFIFTYWWYTDIFIYFSHNFVTVPTVRWINQAHDHDVLCLGTLITEQQSGEDLCSEIFASEDSINKLVRHLVDLCGEFHFDGWLINIENKFEPALITNLLIFLHKLRTDLKERVGPHTQLIWYDSVKTDGSLDWQNALNEYNMSFAEVVDGFYVNYVWTRRELKNTQHILKYERPNIKQIDVYFGVDIFGRGTFGGGQFNSCVGVQAARNYGFSVALFAPGWSTECFRDLEDWVYNHDNVFRPMLDVLHPHRVRRSFRTHFSIGKCDTQFHPAKRTIFPFLLESEHIRLCNEGLRIEGAKNSERVLFLTDFRCVHGFELDHDNRDQLRIDVISKKATLPCLRECRVDIWEIYCVKLDDKPAMLNYLDFNVFN